MATQPGTNPDDGWTYVPPLAKRRRAPILESSEFSPFRYRQWILPTQAIAELLNAIADWIRSGTPGALVYAHSRFGKTKAIAYLKRTINTHLGINWPIFSVTCARNRSDRPMHFYEHFLEDIGYVDPTNGRVTVKRRALLNTIEATCIDRDVYSFILFIDDVQCMIETQWDYLLDIYNQLERRGLQPLIILVGQEEVKDTPGLLRGINQWPVLGRFMQEVYPFRGVESAEDLKRLLRAYDADSAALDREGRPITRIALKEAYGNGLRLETLSEEVWRGLIAAREERMPKMPLKSYPMPVISAGLLGTLAQVAPRDSVDFVPDRTHFKRGFLTRGGGLLSVDYSKSTVNTSMRR